MGKKNKEIYYPGSNPHQHGGIISRCNDEWKWCGIHWRKTSTNREHSEKRDPEGTIANNFYLKEKQESTCGGIKIERSLLIQYATRH